MSSSYGTSMNQSTESGASSLLRSGLNISVGDTKSIVLALQALQQKIRALEQDRDFHQEQYDRALQAHEAYKLDIEAQAEKERAEHHRREQELMELLRKAREEKVRLESAVNGSHDDLSAFRQELEKLIASEKEQSQQRESKLRGEIARLRQEMSEERTKYATLMANVEKLRAEREAAYDTNDELRAAIEDLARLRRQTTSAVMSSSAAANASPQRRAGRAGMQRGRRGHSASTSPAKSHSTHGGHKTYRDPTWNSRLRDVRTTEGEVSCICESHGTASAPSVAAMNASAMDSTRPGTSPRSANASAMRTRPAPAPVTSSYRRPQAPPSQKQPGARALDDGGAPMMVVETQLREELMELQREYKNTIDRASSENLPRNVVNTALERISDLIDKKEEQLRLMQAARREVARASADGGTPSARGEGHMNADVTADKVTQRTMLVNELRSLLAESGKL